MRVFSKARRLQFAAGLGLLLASAVLLSSSDVPVFTKKHLAYYADPSLVDFVRPGLVVAIESASIASDGTIQVKFKVTDPKGLPLDRSGVTTPGAISLSWMASYAVPGTTNYAPITTRTQKSPITNVSAVQGSADTGGTYQQTGDGEYTYTFATKAPSGLDQKATVSVGEYGSRDLTEFGLGTYFANNAVFSWVPAGGTPSVPLEIRTDSCNKCHDPLQAHGGARRAVELCILCHTQPDAIDPDTGNSIDFRQMVHKIHMGAELPSVQAGKPYQIIGFQQSVSDFSTVEYPADPRNCAFCHENTAAPLTVTQPNAPPAPAPSDANAPPAELPALSGYWLQHPSRLACGSCHDNVNFQTGENHVNLPQLSDAQCANCHIVQGELPFDASIVGAHYIPRFAPGVPGVVFTLESVADGSAGKPPTVAFTVHNRTGDPLQLSDMNFLRLTLAGPTTDYTTYWQEDATKAQGANGSYSYTFLKPIPADAKGSWTVGIEGYRNITLLPGTTKSMQVRDTGQNQVLSFSVDGSTLQPYQLAVAEQNCNSCHFRIAAHGDIRNEVAYCVLCHNPNLTDASQRPADKNPPQGLSFEYMIHRIHTGEENEVPFVVYGFGGTPVDFSELRFPGDRRDCSKCHVGTTYELPVPAGRQPVQDPNGFINPMQPATAACLGCHTGQDAAAHAQINTSPNLGESCVVCHGPDAEFSVSREHARVNP